MFSIKRMLSDLGVFRREYLRNRTGLFFALIFPIILIVIFGAIFSGGSSGPINVYLQNQDGPSPVTNAFITALNNTGTVRVIAVNSSVNLSQYLLTHSYTQGIIIPQGFSQSYIAGQPVNLTVYNSPADSSSQVVV